MVRNGEILVMTGSDVLPPGGIPLLMPIAFVSKPLQRSGYWDFSEEKIITLRRVISLRAGISFIPAFSRRVYFFTWVAAPFIPKQLCRFENPNRSVTMNK